MYGAEKERNKVEVGQARFFRDRVELSLSIPVQAFGVLKIDFNSRFSG
jgi:hypothetical protein